MYYIFFDKLLLPVAPEKLSIKINNANKTYKLINDGEINVLKKAGLTDVEFDVLLPNSPYAFAAYKDGFAGAQHFLDAFEALKAGKSTFQFIVSRTLPDGSALFNTNMKVSLENYTIKESASDGFDVVVSIKLKQARAYGTKTCNIQFASTKPVGVLQDVRETVDSPAPEEQSNETYTVESGDCLWNIAKQYYGDGSMYTVIFDANSDQITDPSLIYPGQVLTIPAV